MFTVGIQLAAVLISIQTGLAVALSVVVLAGASLLAASLRLRKKHELGTLAFAFVCACAFLVPWSACLAVIFSLELVTGLAAHYPGIASFGAFLTMLFASFPLLRLSLCFLVPRWFFW